MTVKASLASQREQNFALPSLHPLLTHYVSIIFESIIEKDQSSVNGSSCYLEEETMRVARES